MTSIIILNKQDGKNYLIQEINSIVTCRDTVRHSPMPRQFAKDLLETKLEEERNNPSPSESTIGILEKLIWMHDAFGEGAVRKTVTVKAGTPIKFDDEFPDKLNEGDVAKVNVIDTSKMESLEDKIRKMKAELADRPPAMTAPPEEL